MKCQIQLHPHDIVEIIAEKFGVLPADVSVYTEKTWVGQGPTERETTIAMAKVSIPAERLKMQTKER